MSLAFLAKKSWHTSNLRNVEKVWVAEQKHATEEKKLAELKKNIEEERQMQELRKLQAANGNKSAAVERLDWMYKGPMASSTTDRSSEDYLLGKEYKPDEAGSDARKLGDTAYGALALSKAALPANDAFSRLNEDPMMLMRSQQKRAQEDILKNPVKMKKIKAQVEKLLKDKKDKKKAKKKAKKERKHSKSGKKSHRQRSSSVESHGSDQVDASSKPKSRDESRERQRSPSPVRDDRTHRPHRDERRSRSTERTRRRDDSSRPRSRSRSSDRQRRSEPRRDRSRGRDSRQRGRDSSPNLRRDRSRSADRQRPPDRRRRSSSRDSFGRVATRSPSRTPPRRRDRRDHQPSPQRYNRHDKQDESSRHDRARRSPGDRRSHRRGSSPEPKRQRRSRSHDRRPQSQNADREYVVNRPDDGGKYGLIRQDGAVECKEVDRSTLGPNSKFLEKAREKKREDEQELRRKLSKSASHTSARSHEEMVKEAARMAEDAKAREEFLAQRAAEKREKLDDEEAKLSKDPHFLKQLQDAAYLKGDSSMEDRLRRNSHYIQKRAGASNFLSKD